jgi:hypothetical protein
MDNLLAVLLEIVMVDTMVESLAYSMAGLSVE